MISGQNLFGIYLLFLYSATENCNKAVSVLLAENHCKDRTYLKIL